MNKTKLIPFDIEKAKAGAKIVTRNGLSVRICAYDAVSDYPIIALIELPESKKEVVFSFTKEGTSFKAKDQESKFDLFIEKEVERRLMTQQELSDWLKEFPSEHREYKYMGSHRSCTIVCNSFNYTETEANKPISSNIVIRRNHGKWMKPLIKE